MIHTLPHDSLNGVTSWISLLPVWDVAEHYCCGVAKRLRLRNFVSLGLAVAVPTILVSLKISETEHDLKHTVHCMWFFPSGH